MRRKTEGIEVKESELRWDEGKRESECVRVKVSQLVWEGSRRMR